MNIGKLAALRFVVVVGVGIGLVVGCSAAVCSADACDCPANETCDFGSHSSAARFNCAAGSTCTGSGGAGTNVVCSGVSCTMTVGAGSNVTCGSGTCNLTCQGQCTVACTGGTCNLTCGGGTTRGATGCQ